MGTSRLTNVCGSMVAQRIFSTAFVTEKTRPLSQTIRLRGLPFSTTAVDVEEWLIDKGVRVLRDGVLLELGANGRPSGQAFADVESPEEVDVALRLHGQPMCTRYIEIFEATPRTGAGKSNKTHLRSFVVSNTPRSRNRVSPEPANRAQNPATRAGKYEPNMTQ
ncbi:RNA-binding protein fusilli [Diplonema papillatum]|nr:RNA-binding protein fusilli [Diplonema papillatum]